MKLDERPASPVCAAILRRPNSSPRSPPSDRTKNPRSQERRFRGGSQVESPPGRSPPMARCAPPSGTDVQRVGDGAAPVCRGGCQSEIRRACGGQQLHERNPAPGCGGPHDAPALLEVTTNIPIVRAPRDAKCDGEAARGRGKTSGVVDRGAAAAARIAESDATCGRRGLSGTGPPVVKPPPASRDPHRWRCRRLTSPCVTS